MNDFIDTAGLGLRSAKRIAVLTGAGLSAESGIPTFRDALTGLWAQYDPAELATPDAFARNPALVSRWYDERRCQIARCRPNPGHLALDRLQQILSAKGVPCTLITQNVDRLQQAAGTTDVLELHGTLWVWQCINCLHTAEEIGPAFNIYPPLCRCGGNRRPCVVWFGETLAPDILAAAQQAVASCDYFMSIGTSSVVYPAAGLIEEALRSGVRMLEVNPDTTPFSDQATWSIRGRSGEILPQIVEYAFGPCDRVL